MINSMQKTKTATFFILLLIVLLGCSQQNIPLASITGIYDDGLLTIGFDYKNKILEGSIYQEIPALGQNESDVCNISFVSLEQDKLTDKEIEIIAQAKGDENSYSGILVVDEGKVRIQFDTPIFPCQRVIDLNGGETFSRSEI